MTEPSIPDPRLRQALEHLKTLAVELTAAEHEFTVETHRALNDYLLAIVSQLYAVIQLLADKSVLTLAEVETAASIIQCELLLDPRLLDPPADDPAPESDATPETP